MLSTARLPIIAYIEIIFPQVMSDLNNSLATELSGNNNSGNSW